MSYPERNDPCPCGSGLKYKKCCLGKNVGLRKVLPSPPTNQNKLGNVFPELDHLDRYSRALTLKPDAADIQNSQGNRLLAQGKLDDAMSCYRKALNLKPDLVDAHYNLGSILQEQGQLDAAIKSYRHALTLMPGYADAHFNLGVALQDQGNLDAAITHYRNVLAINPAYTKAHYNLGAALQSQGELDEAISCYHKVLALEPNYADAYSNIGNALKDQGKMEAAIDSYRKALAIRPDFIEAYSILLMLHCYHVLPDPEEYLLLARGWEQACLPEFDRLRAHNRTFQRLPSAGRRLRVGYVSGDYHQHVVSYFIEQLFACHERTRIELFAYSTNPKHDVVTERLRALVEHWVPVAGLADAAIRDRIEADGIDVLVDLSGHTTNGRLGIFARRAAPVQAHYLGFMASTGLSEMDYWIGDDYLTPPATDSHFSEHVWRLSRVSVSYKTIGDAPEPNWLPAQNEIAWLGSFNTLIKITPATLALWAKVLLALPQGRLLLKNKELADAVNRQHILDSMASYGISPDRIELQSSDITPGWREHMAYYNRLDIALDPVGGHGGNTTTCDTLWMGVPVIALEGDRMGSRMTASMLNALGHPEWIAASETEYIEKVVALARDVELRKTLRSTQRERMALSPLCDARDLAKAMEDAYLEMFERWLAKQDEALPNAKNKLS